MRGMDYFIKRTIFALITVFVAISLNFVLFRAIPGNAVSGLKCLHCTKQFKEAITKQYGLDQSKWQQYRIYLERLAHGDLGTSVVNNRPVWDDIKQPFLNTLPMIAIGTVVSILLGIFSGVIAAWRRGNKVGDTANMWTALTMYAAPTQWIGLLVIFYIALPLGLPAAGISSNTLGLFGNASEWATLKDRFDHLILPALTLGIGLYGEYALIVRSSMLETLGEDYVLTARAKGLPNWAIVWKHGLRNAMLPLITLIALSLGYIVAGAIVVEDVFSYPGIGLYTIQAIDQRDYAVLQGIFLLLTLAVIAANFVADILYFAFDPRVTS
jgi:ABC-type dipeptide/oligopeptide/nickel transport system permease component